MQPIKHHRTSTLQIVPNYDLLPIHEPFGHFLFLLLKSCKQILILIGLQRRSNQSGGVRVVVLSVIRYVESALWDGLFGFLRF